MSTTISDVAKLAGVSKSTVSNYINGKFDRMADETKRSIEQTIKELGYTPNLSARRLPNKEKSKTICLIIPRNLTHLFDSLYYPTVFHSIEKLAATMKYNILIYSRNREDVSNEMMFLKGMASSMVDGYIIFDLSGKDLFFKEFEAAGIPYVCVGKIDNYEDYNYVASDHKNVIEDTIKYLFQLGHEKIGVFHQMDSSVVEAVRKSGITDVCLREKIPLDDIQDIFIPAKSTEGEMYNKWKEVLQWENHPTAYVISSAVRQPMLLAASDLNLSIPEDISYVNIEYYRKNSTVAEDQTRVESKAGEVAEIAFKKLLKLIYQPASKFEPQLVPLTLTLGETTAVYRGQKTMEDTK